MGLGALGAVYGWVGARRRARFRRRPDLVRRLTRPVISVGNLTVGGSGKTPLVMALAAALRDAGERPAILSRGYARRGATAEVVVVSDGDRVRVAVDASGDEPQVMARRLPGVPVLVGRDRYEAGCVAERDFGCTIHLLDDGFQHLQLARDVDLLVVRAADVADRVLPAGRLREPASAAWQADAWLSVDSADDISRALVSAGQGPAAGQSTPPVFGVTTRVGVARSLAPFGVVADLAPGPAIAVSAIARPERFVEAARSAGWRLEREMRFRDHHWFTDADWRDIVEAARDAGAVVLTTEKDAVRLESRVAATASGPQVLYLPIDVEVPDACLAWLTARLAERRA